MQYMLHIASLQALQRSLPHQLTSRMSQLATHCVMRCLKQPQRLLQVHISRSAAGPTNKPSLGDFAQAHIQ
jgi:hypothetical protein